MSKLIVFEGLDGTGKSSLMLSLAQHFLKLGASVHLTAYPRKTNSGAIARKLIEENALVEKQFHYLLRDILEGNAWVSTTSADFVLVDRYYYSLLAYQCGYCGLPLKEIYSRKNTFKLIAQPDLCIYTYCDFQISKWRIINRDGLESSDLKFYSDIETWQKMRSLYNIAFSLKMLEPKKLISVNTETDTDDMMGLMPSNFLKNLCLAAN